MSKRVITGGLGDIVRSKRLELDLSRDVVAVYLAGLEISHEGSVESERKNSASEE